MKQSSRLSISTVGLGGHGKKLGAIQPIVSIAEQNANPLVLQKLPKYSRRMTYG
jgi:hypothetical protein